jgi:hypothetical protein
LQSNTKVVKAAYEAIKRGYQPIPLHPKEKKPRISGFLRMEWPKDTTLEEVQQKFDEWGRNSDGISNLGVVLGETSGNLLDVDLDHHRTARLKDYFLPPTPARSGRPGKPNSHYWYIAEEGTLPGLRKYLMPRVLDDDSGRWKPGPVIVEMRSTGGQTAIPPSVHPTGELYNWSGGKAWGGSRGPAVVNGRRLAVQVALLALASCLLECWPGAGVRHEAYLALAGGLLRDGDGVHPYWEQNASVLIRALADATLDDDGPDSREAESIGSTIKQLQDGRPVTGFGKLAELIGNEEVRQIRILVGEVESAAGVRSRQATVAEVVAEPSLSSDPSGLEPGDEQGALTPDSGDPLVDRQGSWEPLDLEPYLSGRISPVMPTVLMREDGQALLYPGRVNMLYGTSESAKSWIALYTCLQVMADGQRVMYLDFEDEPVNTLDRLKRLGASNDDLSYLFSYVRPEDPLAPMQRDRWGNHSENAVGIKNWDLFKKAVELVDPTLIVADGMTVLYGLHGLDSNDAVSTDIITGWLKRLTRNGRSTVIIIDHTSKGSERGSTPIGSQHKQAMVQGTMIQVWPVRQPMPDAEGEVELIVLKDRPGQVRRVSVKSGLKAQLAAKVIIDSTVPDITNISIQAPPSAADKQAQDAKLAAEAARAQLFKADEDAVLALFGNKRGTELSMNQIAQLIGMQREKNEKDEWVWPKDEYRRWADATNRLFQKGYITGNGKKTRAYAYVLVLEEDDSNGVEIDLSSAGTD